VRKGKREGKKGGFKVKPMEVIHSLGYLRSPVNDGCIGNIIFFSNEGLQRTTWGKLKHDQKLIFLDTEPLEFHNVGVKRKSAMLEGKGDPSSLTAFTFQKCRGRGEGERERGREGENVSRVASFSRI